MTTQQRMELLKNRARAVEVFSYEGIMYFGNLNYAISLFCNQTSYPADFHVWLQKHEATFPPVENKILEQA